MSFPNGSTLRDDSLHLDDHQTLIEGESGVVRTLPSCNIPGMFKCIAQRIFEPVRPAAPDLDHTVFSLTGDDGKRVKETLIVYPTRACQYQHRI